MGKFYVVRLGAIRDWGETDSVWAEVKTTSTAAAVRGKVFSAIQMQLVLDPRVGQTH